MRKRLSVITTFTAAGSLVLAGCLSEGGDAGGGEAGGEGDGVVTIFGAFSAEEEQLFNESLTEFEEESGIDIQYTASGDFDTLIRTRVAGNNAPDIALFPQPGLLVDLANEGNLVPLSDVVDVATVEETVIPGFLEAATGDDGEIYGAPMRMAVKSLVWHPAPEYEEMGLPVPESHEQLVDVSQQILDEGVTPWCLGMGSEAATGWPMTDWLEEYVLRVGGPDVYDQWVNHEIPFNDPAILEAAQKVEEIALANGFVIGGAQGIINTPFGESPLPLFDEPPGCMLHRQGNFITGFFPPEVQEDLASNVGLFVLPPVEDGYDGQPILGGGDLAAAFTSDEEVAQVMEFLTSPEFGGPWAEAGGWLSPHRTFDVEQYPDEITKQMAQIASEADVFRFDASDLMPGQVGTGSFWEGMIAWMSGEDIEVVLENIENSWPES